jgi:SecDF, P1 head subdomain
MTNLRELLQDADPLAHEPLAPPQRHAARRAAVLAAASTPGARAAAAPRSRMAVFAAVAVLLLVAAFLGARMWSPFVSDVQAAVRFEVRLAEEQPAPGLREAKIGDTGRSVYLHAETIVTNSDIASAQVVPGDAPAEYRLDVKFTAGGAAKMRAATASHIGKPVAILLDGQVVMAPVVRTPIADAAMVTGHFTRDQAEKLASGIRIQ